MTHAQVHETSEFDGRKAPHTEVTPSRLSGVATRPITSESTLRDRLVPLHDGPAAAGQGAGQDFTGVPSHAETYGSGIARGAEAGVQRAPTLPTSAGQPLDRKVGETFESQFGTDVRNVRVHTDGHAHETSRLLQARAFTVGKDVYFGQGEYLPTTTEGRRLLAHELTHAMQPGSGPAAQGVPYFTVDRSDSPAERTAAHQAVLSGSSGTRDQAAARRPARAADARPLVHRQPEQGASIKMPTVVVFASQPDDMAAARRLATNLAEKIRQRTMTDDDYDVLGQGGRHYSGRAAAVFQQIVQSAIQDRDVLSAVGREAPPAPGSATGSVSMPPVLVAAHMTPGSVGDAKRIGKRHGDALRQASISSGVRDEIEATIRFFDGDARVAYRVELSRAIAEVRAKTEQHQSGQRTLTGTQPSRYGDGFGPTSRFEETRTEVMPVSEPKVDFGFAVSLTAEVRAQSSDSVSVEYYSDYSVGADVSLKVPISKIIDVKLGAGAKKGRKEAEKSETANVKSTGKKISRDYQVDTLVREVVRTVHKSTRDETRPKSGAGFVIVDEIADVLVDDPKDASDKVAAGGRETQTGYRVTVKSGSGKKDVWPTYIGTTESPAVHGLETLLQEDGAQLAREVAKLVDGGVF